MNPTISYIIYYHTPLICTLIEVKDCVHKSIHTQTHGHIQAHNRTITRAAYELFGYDNILILVFE